MRWLLSLLLLPARPVGAAGHEGSPLDLTAHPVGVLALGLFVFAYLLVMTEEFTHLRKSKPVVLMAGVIWTMIGWIYQQHGMSEMAVRVMRHDLLEFAELGLFLLVAMTYINSMEERRVFEALRSWLVRQRLGYRRLFWVTGLLAFFISPVADNLTTALLLCAVVMAMAGGNRLFVTLACINIVVAANAGGAFSPFGDITTLMVWQKGVVEFWSFFLLFIPALINFLVPAVIMHFSVPAKRPRVGRDHVHMKRGARRIVALFLLTIVTAVGLHQILDFPPVIGMLTGLGYLQFFGYYLKMTAHKDRDREPSDEIGDVVAFDVFRGIARAEWDTLFFFYGVVMCVGGLGFIGYLARASEVLYHGWGATTANVVIGLLSSVVDNIPVMFAVLSMHPDMPVGQWLLVTLTTGVGGSLLSIGSAAGVALMGQSKGMYTFFGHLRWTPVVALGYIAGIAAHMWINAYVF